MTEICKYVDVFGIIAEKNDGSSGRIEEDSFLAEAQQLQQWFDFKFAANILRESMSASDNNWSAILYDGK